MEEKEYEIVKTFQRVSPEEMFQRNLNRISKADYIRMAVKGLERNQAVLVPRNLINETSVRVSVNRINGDYKKMYKEEGYSDRLRKYSTHRESAGLAVVRMV